MNQKELDILIKDLEKVKTKQIDKFWNLNDFKGKKIMTFGTFDLFHIGHKKIIDHCIEITGDPKNVVVGVSSDRWNLLKNKKSFESEEIRLQKIIENYPGINVIFEDHNNFEESWGELWDENNIDLIIMGGDHFDNLSYINTRITPKNNQMKISFFERTKKISSTILRGLDK